MTPVEPASPQPVRVAGLATATGEHWVRSDAFAASLSSIWPNLDTRIAHLLEQSGTDGRFFSRPIDELGTPLTLSVQGARYTDIALRMAAAAATHAIAVAGCDPHTIGAIIVASCTGFVLPGLDTRLVPMLGLRRDVVRMPFTQLGCAGGAVALARGADWVRGEPGRRALVIAVELPSLAFRPDDHSTDNLLSALVFSDGAGAAVLERGDEPATTTAAPGEPAVLHLGRSTGVLLDDSTALLGYELADDGFRIILSRRLPSILEARLGGIVTAFLSTAGPAVAALDVVAAHPGGTAVLEAVQRSLGATPPQLDASWRTFRTFGNSSSAALYFVLEAAVRAAPPVGSRGLVIGFGPGLAVELQELSWAG